MCGVFGFSLNRTLETRDIEVGKTALGLLNHRGPDHKGHWYDIEKGLFLGHTRLSILDLSQENNQPMTGDKSVLSFNGEIYNFKSIKTKLESLGHKFKTSGDTEVVLKALDSWGESALSEFDGMFALAHYKGGVLKLATDCFGEKPLYIYSVEGGIYFSSEITVLKKLFKLNLNLTESEYGLFAGLGFLPAPHTGYQDIIKMGPAQVAIYDTNDRKLKVKTFWKLPTKQATDRKPVLEKQDIKLFQETIISSIESRLEADVPVGLFLSAGIDSMLIASILKKELLKDNLCLTVKFNSRFVQDESVRAKASANFLGLNHMIIQPDDNLEIEDELAFIKDAFGEPNDNLTVLSTYSMSKQARKYVKVALSGTGGDELFYGYNKYSGLAFIQRLKQRFGMSKPFIPLVEPFKGFSTKIKRFVDYMGVPNEQAYLLIKNYSGFNHLKQHKSLLDFFSDTFEKENKDIVHNARLFDVSHTLPNSYIPYLERGSMKASLEVRCPFLNKELYELTDQFTASAFLQHGQKWVLKRILENYLPKEYFDYSKMGFINPRQEFNLRNFNPDKLDSIVHRNKLGTNYTSIQNAGLTEIVLRYALLDKEN